MKSTFEKYLAETGEIGYVEEVAHAIVQASGLPNVLPTELVVFESGERGQVISLGRERVEILVFSKTVPRAGSRLTRTDQFLQVPVGDELLGNIIDPLGYSLDLTKPIKVPKVKRPIDTVPSGIKMRKRIKKPLETGVALVDLVVPLGKGQRELVIGDRKTGKTSFLLQTILHQARSGTLCIYAAIGKKKLDVKKIEEFFRKHKIGAKTIIVASTPHDPPGIVYITPYSAMTIAEHFRDLGREVLLVLDDLTTHAKFYREISLLGKRFPGRNSYPGDIFHTHARLLERAGNFMGILGESSITCLPVVETTQGDLSGYIQTNAMSMTDGHIYFDSDLFAKGRRPAVNPFLSVTRVGRQTQPTVRREINRELVSFLTLFEKMQRFIHFGAELSETIRNTLTTGERIIAFFDQTKRGAVHPNLHVFLFTLLWIGRWQDKPIETMQEEMEKIVATYEKKKSLRSLINEIVEKAVSFNGLLSEVRERADAILVQAGFSPPALKPPQTVGSGYLVAQAHKPNGEVQRRTKT